MCRTNGALAKALSTATTTLNQSAVTLSFNNGNVNAAPSQPAPGGATQFTIIPSGDFAPGFVTAIPNNRNNFYLTSWGTTPVSPINGVGTDNTLAIDWRPAHDQLNVRLTSGNAYAQNAAYAAAQISSLAAKVRSEIDSETNYVALLNATVENRDSDGSAISFTNFSGIMKAPKIELPMYKYLYSLSPDAFLPQVNRLPQNSVSIFKTRQDVIEAFFVGLNHEIAREMLWREYPTDQRGTVFNKFWGSFVSPDISNPQNSDYEALRAIKPLHNWKSGASLSALGQNQAAGAASPKLFMAVRGELLKKYPDTYVYMQRAKWDQTEGVDDHAKSRLVDGTQDPIYPLVFAQFSDIVIFGFDLEEDVAKGTEIEPPYTGYANPDPGYFFVFRETPTGLHFGMDVPDPTETIPTSPYTVDSWDELHWNYFHGLNFVDVFRSITSNSIDDSSLWGVNSAEMSDILYQKPILLSIHAKDLLR